jgi:hypothetical protein
LETTFLFRLHWAKAIKCCFIFSEWAGTFDVSFFFASGCCCRIAAPYFPRIVIATFGSNTLELVTSGTFEATAVGEA